MTNKSTARDVNGKVTPISETPIPQVDTPSWNDMTTDELFEQRSILQERIYAVNTYSPNMSVVAQLQNGINHIDYILATQHKSDPTAGTLL